MLRKSGRAAILAATVFVSIPAVVCAQTSGSWINNGNGNWSDPANWNPAVPDGGGVATFTTHPQQGGARTVTLDMPVSLNGMVVDSVFVWTVTGAQTMTLTGPATISVPTAIASTPTSSPVPSAVNSVIAGSSGLVKTGPGGFSLGGTNTYTGGTTVTGGILRTSVGDAAFGDPSGNITLDGGAVRISTVDIASARNFVLGAGGGTLEMFFNGAFSGGISGSGNLNKTISGTIAFQGANTYTGATNLNAEGRRHQNFAAGTTFFQGNGSALATSAVNSSGTVVLDNTATNINGRLNPNAPVTMNGAELRLLGNAAAATSENLGALTGRGGQTFVTVVPNSAQSSQMTLASWSRGDRGVTVFRGVGLGNAPGSNVSNVFLTAAPTMVGGGGAAGSTNISIIPGAMGGTTATATGTDLVTYGPNGVRPLSTTGEYATLAAAGPTDNARQTAATALAADQTVNAYVVGGGALTGPGNTLTITSGMFLNGSIQNHTVNLNFGSAEGILHMSSSGTFSGSISGSNGLTKSGINIATLSNSNTYTGPTTIVAGSARVSGDVPVNAPSAFGNSADPIIIVPGGTAASVLASANLTFSRDLIVRGNGTGTANFGTTGTTQLLTMNGNVTLERTLHSDSGASNPITYNGTISGDGRLTDVSSTMSIINGNNTAWSGGVEVQTGSYYAGHDNAFGTGPLYLAGIGTIGAANSSRTIANPIVMFTPTTFNIGSSPLAGGPQDITFTGTFDLGSAVRTVQVPTGVTATFGGVVSAGGITKTGAGTLRLTGANEYTAGTTVNAGMLVVDNTTGSGTGGGNVAINAATLAGNGSMAGGISVAGTGALSPGTGGPGTLTGGGLSLADATSLIWDLDIPNIVGGGVNDLMVSNGGLVLDGVLTVNAGANFGEGVYTLMTYSGTLVDNGVVVGPLPSPFEGSIDTSVAGEVRLVVIPEPGTIALFGATALAGLLRRRRGAPR